MGKVKVHKDNTERYLLTYADLMNLLLILFIILFAYSQVDTQKFQQLSQSLGAAFGNGSPPSVVQGSTSGNSLIDFPATMPSPIIPSKLEEQQIEGLGEELSGMIKSEGLGGDVSVKMTERGVIMSIDASLAFKSGSAELEKDSMDKVLKIGKEILSKIPDKHIRVEGHTDNVPIKSAIFPSNWQLSAVRAANVLMMLVDKAGISSDLISAVGYGDSAPLVENNSDANREKNRRVDIVILRDASSVGEASTDSTNNTTNGDKNSVNSNVK